MKRISPFGLVKDRKTELKLLLRTCKRQHILACDTVDTINSCLGSTLLLSTAFFFVAITNYIFYIFCSYGTITIQDVLFEAANLIHLTIVCFAADHVRYQVTEYFNFSMAVSNRIYKCHYFTGRGRIE